MRTTANYQVQNIKIVKILYNAFLKLAQWKLRWNLAIPLAKWKLPTPKKNIKRKIGRTIVFRQLEMLLQLRPFCTAIWPLWTCAWSMPPLPILRKSDVGRQRDRLLHKQLSSLTDLQLQSYNLQLWDYDYYDYNLQIHSYLSLNFTMRLTITNKYVRINARTQFIVTVLSQSS